MKPRVFVSSTFYDLKHVREDLANFIRAHDFEPILFEDGDIGYIPGQSPDKSCYKTMKTADMVVLIIGGNYGSPAFGEIPDEFDEYISVTREEFRVAIKAGIPLYAFIDKKVYSEYEIYELNIDRIENKGERIKFKNTKNINIFRFIKEIKTLGDISVIEFHKIVDIKEFLSKQWSDMFKTYLTILRERKFDLKMEEDVKEIQTLIKKMDVMLDAIGKKTLSSENSNEYSMVINRQRILWFCDSLIDEIAIESEEFQIFDREKQIEYWLNILFEMMDREFFGEILDGIKCKNKVQEGKGMVKMFEYFQEKELSVSSVSHSIVKTLERNKEILGNHNLREIIVDELAKEKNYGRFFGF